MTVADYRSKADRYIIPNIGGVQLAALTPMQVQKLCNRLKLGHDDQRPLSPKSVKNIHGILHSALKRAVLVGVLRSNPADNTELPRVSKPDLKPLMDDDIGRFLQAIRGDRDVYKRQVRMSSSIKSVSVSTRWVSRSRVMTVSRSERYAPRADRNSSFNRSSVRWGVSHLCSPLNLSLHCQMTRR